MGTLHSHNAATIGGSTRSGSGHHEGSKPAQTLTLCPCANGSSANSTPGFIDRTAGYNGHHLLSALGTPAGQRETTESLVRMLLMMRYPAIQRRILARLSIAQVIAFLSAIVRDRTRPGQFRTPERLDGNRRRLYESVVSVLEAMPVVRLVDRLSAAAGDPFMQGQRSSAKGQHGGVKEGDTGDDPLDDDDDILSNSRSLQYQLRVGSAEYKWLVEYGTAMAEERRRVQTEAQTATQSQPTMQTAQNTQTLQPEQSESQTQTMQAAQAIQVAQAMQVTAQAQVSNNQDSGMPSSSPEGKNRNTESSSNTLSTASAAAAGAVITFPLVDLRTRKLNRAEGFVRLFAQKVHTTNGRLNRLVSPTILSRLRGLTVTNAENWDIMQCCHGLTRLVVYGNGVGSEMIAQIVHNNPHIAHLYYKGHAAGANDQLVVLSEGETHYDLIFFDKVCWEFIEKYGGANVIRARVVIGDGTGLTDSIKSEKIDSNDAVKIESPTLEASEAIESDSGANQAGIKSEITSTATDTPSVNAAFAPPSIDLPTIFSRLPVLRAFELDCLFTSTWIPIKFGIMPTSTHLRRLTLTQCAFTDCNFAQFSHLERLTLANCKINASALSSLPDKRIRVIRLADTEINWDSMLTLPLSLQRLILLNHSVDACKDMVYASYGITAASATGADMDRVVAIEVNSVQLAARLPCSDKLAVWKPDNSSTDRAVSLPGGITRLTLAVFPNFSSVDLEGLQLSTPVVIKKAIVALYAYGSLWHRPVHLPSSDKVDYNTTYVNLNRVKRQEALSNAAELKEENRRRYRKRHSALGSSGRRGKRSRRHQGSSGNMRHTAASAEGSGDESGYDSEGKPRGHGGRPRVPVLGATDAEVPTADGKYVDMNAEDLSVFEEGYQGRRLPFPVAKHTAPPLATPDDPTKPYQCRFCKRSFDRRENFRRHSLIHTDYRPYVCPKCKKGFKRSDNLRSHMRVCHNAAHVPKPRGRHKKMGRPPRVSDHKEMMRQHQVQFQITTTGPPPSDAIAAVAAGSAAAESTRGSVRSYQAQSGSPNSAAGAGSNGAVPHIRGQLMTIAPKPSDMANMIPMKPIKFVRSSLEPKGLKIRMEGPTSSNLGQDAQSVGMQQGMNPMQSVRFKFRLPPITGMNNTGVPSSAGSSSSISPPGTASTPSTSLPSSRAQPGNGVPGQSAQMMIPGFGNSQMNQQPYSNNLYEFVPSAKTMGGGILKLSRPRQPPVPGRRPGRPRAENPFAKPVRPDDIESSSDVREMNTSDLQGPADGTELATTSTTPADTVTATSGTSHPSHLTQEQMQQTFMNVNPDSNAQKNKVLVFRMEKPEEILARQRREAEQRQNSGNHNMGPASEQMERRRGVIREKVNKAFLQCKKTEDGHYVCYKCGKNFAKRGNVKRHLILHLDVDLYDCICGRTFRRSDNYKMHFSKCKKRRELGLPLTFDAKDIEAFSRPKRSPYEGEEENTGFSSPGGVSILNNGENSKDDKEKK